VVVFAFVLLVIVGVAATAIWWMGRNTFYVGFDGDDVVIFRGQPGGVLWIDPTVEESTDVRRGEVPARRRRALEDGVEQPTLDEARAYVASLEEEIEEARPTTTTRPRPTTTTARPTTTTAAPGT
jgi:hypothetical protein